LGFTPKLSEVHKFIDQVDFDANQTIDFREFLRLMRMLVEDEIKRARNAFKLFMAQPENVLPGQCLRAAMLATDVRWSKLPRETFASLLKEQNNPDVLSFDDFVEIVQSGRNILAKETRRQAGFSQKELDEFKDLFSTYDKDKNGRIERSELVSLLKDLQIPMRNFSDQQKMLQMLREAKAAARDAGLEADDSADDSHPQVSFWMLVYFLRALCNKDDSANDKLENRAALETGFSHHEVTEFRFVYEQWVAIESRDPKHHKQAAQRSADFVGSLASSADESRKRLTINGLSCLLRSLECSLTLPLLAELETQVNALDPKGGGELDFPNFLRLMKWVMVENFADINGKVASTLVVWSAEEVESWIKATSNMAQTAVESGSELNECVAIIDSRWEAAIPSIPPDLRDATEDRVKEMRAATTSSHTAHTTSK
jgi:Ca2+-binding EF-hand superfamily protein